MTETLEGAVASNGGGVNLSIAEPKLFRLNLLLRGFADVPAHPLPRDRRIWRGPFDGGGRDPQTFAAHSRCGCFLDFFREVDFISLLELVFVVRPHMLPAAGLEAAAVPTVDGRPRL